MSKKEFELKKAIINAIPDEDVKYPNMPIDAALQEAEDLFVWCSEDKDMLIKGGLDWSLVNDLQVRTGACRYAQSIWQMEYRSLEDAQREWRQKSPEAYDLRDELLHHFNFAFRNAKDLLNRTKNISHGRTHADMIQDLSDLSALGKDNKELLEKVNFDLNLLDQALIIADKMSILLAKANGQKLKDNGIRLLRDKAYAHLKDAVDEIRKFGTYVFWKNETRKKGYVSRYNKKKSRKSRVETEISGLEIANVNGKE